MSDMNHDHDLEAKKALRPQVQRDQTYWLSLDHYDQDPEFLKLAEQEFLSSPLKEGDAEDGVARRDFLKLMGASLAMASAGCIRRPVQKIVPYNKQPEEVVLGVPNYYSSVAFDGSEAMGILVKTREGRPVKIEGNHSHPLNMGVSIKAQSSVLNLYDPERLRGPRKNLFNEKKTNKDTIMTSWDSADGEIAKQLKKGDVVVLTGAVTGPANQAVIREFCQGFKARHVVFEPLSHEEIREGQRLSYGDDSVPFHDFSEAKMIVSVDADFLGSWLTPMTFSKQFSQGRKNPETGMSRLVVFDSNYSLTGANADIRIRLKPSQQLEVVLGLLHELIVKKGYSSYSGNAAVRSVLGAGEGIAARLGIEPALFSRIAEDLWENRGKSLVVAGGLPTMTAQATELQIAVNFLNSVLGNDGSTVKGRGANPGLTASWKELMALIQDMNDGKVKTLIMNNVNPVYALAGSQSLLDAMKKVEMVVSTADRMDETADHAHFILPDNHPLESWGDAEPVAGVIMVQQPTIRPMYETRAFQTSLLRWAQLGEAGSSRLRGSETFFDYLQAVWKEDGARYRGGKSFDAFWGEALKNGFVGSPAGAPARSFRVDAFTSIRAARSSSDQTELVLYPTVMMGDGSGTNAAWLHELPDPVTKITWDNYASVSIAFAKKHGLKANDVIEITVGDKKIDLPVNVQPGLHDQVMAVAVGYGRTRAGKVANGIGRNMYPFFSFAGGKLIASGAKVEFKKTGRTESLANPQGHHSMEGRQIVVEATLKEYQKKKDANIHRAHMWSVWSGHQYNGHKWGMAIDLNSCTGCNACVISCQSENNIPVVGKKYVLQGREMHWLRIDRYYVGTPENAEVVFQPMLCQHCDNAPCETVCPVLATVHTDDGLNSMVYNRCVGTRYCSNNCPYKVRRFNWFNYTNKIEKPLNMALNPDVTVRTRGVMEKCTFCVQRIKAGVNKAKQENRPLRDGEIKTACQTACPSEGIVFGDMNDPNSEVSRMFKQERAYLLLEEWNAAPSVRYLTKIRNNGKDSRHGEKTALGEGEHA